MAYTNKRVGISYISDKSDLPSLYNEEILVDKLTGEICVKTPTKGNVISYNYLTRFNTHIQRLISNTYSHAMINSQIMKITPDNMVYPATEGILNTNLIGDSPIDIDQGCFNIMISIDMDCVDVAEGEIVNNTHYDIPVTYELMSTYLQDQVRIYSGQTTLAEFNSTVFSFPERNDGITITKLIIGETQQTTPVRYILNSICGLFHTDGTYKIVSIFADKQHSNEQFRTMPFTPDEIVIIGENARDEVSVITDYTYEIFYIDGDNLIPDAVDGGVFEYDGQHRIVFTYGKLTTSYDFDVTREAIVELYMVSEPNRASYELGESLDMTGMELRAVYNTGVVTNVTDYEISGFDNNTVGECCISIGCDGCSIDYTVEIVDCMWQYIINDNEITLIRYFGRDRVVNVPSAIDGYPVVAIEVPTFYANPYICTVNIPDTVRTIG
jgi:hypothetical protein